MAVIGAEVLCSISAFSGFDPSNIGRHLMLQKASSGKCLPFLCSFLTAKKRPHSEAAKVTRKDRFIYQR